MRSRSTPRNSSSFRVRPIGVIHSPLSKPEGAPIQSRLAREVEGTVEVFPQFQDGLQDLEGFERIWLVYWFHRAAKPRLRVIPFLDHQERGLFATRAPCRPNPIGISPVRLTRIDANVLTVAELDILDGTPLLDIKPYSPYFDCFQPSRSGWLDATKPSRSVADSRFEDANLGKRKETAGLRRPAKRPAHSQVPAQTLRISRDHQLRPSSRPNRSRNRSS